MDGRRIYLMRHGETLYQSRASEGAIGNGALTERGREQIAAVALLFRGVPLDRIYASPLSRAHETAQIIAREKGLDVVLSPDLREITPSDEMLAGKSTAAIFQEVQRFFKSPTTSWDEPYLGGESFRQVQERGVRFLDSLLSQADWQTVLVVAHGGINNALIAYGLSRCRLLEPAGKVLTGLFDASLFLDLRRMPELFCGFPRRAADEGPPELRRRGQV